MKAWSNSASVERQLLCAAASLHTCFKTPSDDALVIAFLRPKTAEPLFSCRRTHYPRAFFGKSRTRFIDFCVQVTMAPSTLDFQPDAALHREESSDADSRNFPPKIDFRNWRSNLKWKYNKCL
jgi:hypothetical protein